MAFGKAGGITLGEYVRRHNIQAQVPAAGLENLYPSDQLENLYPPRAPISFGFPKPGIALAGEPKPGYVRLRAGFLASSLDLWMAGTPRMASESYAGGVEEIPRQGRADLTVPAGTRPLRQILPALLERGMEYPGDVEKAWQHLERLARPVSGEERPKLTLSGPVLHTDRQWWIDGLEIGDDDVDWHRIGGKLVRIRVDVTVVQVVTTDLVTRPVKDDRRGVRGRTTAKKGETLADVAKRELGSRRKADELGKANGLRDPDRKFTKDTLLWLPAEKKKN